MNGESVYMYEAIRRAKDNGHCGNPVKNGVHREIQYPHQTEGEVIERLENRICRTPGIWRIYRSVNSRDTLKAKIDLINILVQQLAAPMSVTKKNPESIWKTALMQPKNRAERKYLVDIDTKDWEMVLQIQEVIAGQWGILETIETPNGYHLITRPFDARLLAIWKDVASVQKDALYFVKKLEVPSHA